MSKIAVSGGAGFIGSHLTDKLIEQGHEVIVIDNLYNGKKENINPKATFYEEDICDFDKIRPLFNEVDYVFHLAAIPRVPFSMENPSLTTKVNVLGSVNVFKAAAEAGVKRVIFASSSSVYASQEKQALSEDMPTNPISPYALQKLTGEMFAQLFTKIYNIPIVTLRFFNVYGSRIDFNSDYSLVIGKFLKLNKQGKPLTIFGDGEQTRGFSYIDDTVDANIKAMESDKLKGGEVINVGNDKSYSVNYLAELIGGEKEYLPPRSGDQLHSKSDISKAKELLGWEPKVSFEDGVQKIKDWFKQVSN